jgi:hypothetical protein
VPARYKASAATFIMAPLAFVSELLFSAFQLVIVWPLQLLTFVLQAALTLWQYKGLLISALLVGAFVFFWNHTHDELFKVVDDVYACTLKPFYDKTLRVLLDTIRALYNRVICWWNFVANFWRIVIFEAVAIFFRCGHEQELFQSGAQLFSLTTNAYLGWFSGPDPLSSNTTVDFEPVADKLGEFADALNVNADCQCNDLSFLWWSLIFSVFSDPQFKCALTNFLDATIMAFQVPLGFVESIVQFSGDLNTIVRPDFVPFFDKLITSVKCTTTALDNALQRVVDEFFGVDGVSGAPNRPLPGVFCLVQINGQFIATALKFMSVILDIVFNLDRLYVNLNPTNASDVFPLYILDVDIAGLFNEARGVADCFADILEVIDELLIEFDEALEAESGFRVGYTEKLLSCLFRTYAYFIIELVEIYWNVVIRFYRLIDWDELFGIATIDNVELTTYLREVQWDTLWDLARAPNAAADDGFFDCVAKLLGLIDINLAQLGVPSFQGACFERLFKTAAAVLVNVFKAAVDLVSNWDLIVKQGPSRIRQILDLDTLFWDLLRNPEILDVNVATPDRTRNGFWDCVGDIVNILDAGNFFNGCLGKLVALAGALSVQLSELLADALLNIDRITDWVEQDLDARLEIIYDLLRCPPAIVCAQQRFIDCVCTIVNFFLDPIPGLPNNVCCLLEHAFVAGVEVVRAVLRILVNYDELGGFRYLTCLTCAEDHLTGSVSNADRQLYKTCREQECLDLTDAFAAVDALLLCARDLLTIVGDCAANLVFAYFNQFVVLAHFTVDLAQTFPYTLAAYTTDNTQESDDVLVDFDHLIAAYSLFFEAVGCMVGEIYPTTCIGTNQCRGGTITGPEEVFGGDGLTNPGLSGALFDVLFIWWQIGFDVLEGSYDVSSGDFIEDLLNDIYDPIANAGLAVADAITCFYGNDVGAIVCGLFDVLNQIKGVLINIVLCIVNLVQTFLAMVNAVTNGGDITGTTGAFIGAIVGCIDASVGSLFDFIIALIEGLTGIDLNFLVDVVDDIVDVFDDVLDELIMFWNMFEDTLTDVVTFFEDVGNDLQEVVDCVLDIVDCVCSQTVLCKRDVALMPHNNRGLPPGYWPKQHMEMYASLWTGDTFCDQYVRNMSLDASVLWEHMSMLEQGQYMDCTDKQMLGNALHKTWAFVEPDLFYNVNTQTRTLENFSHLAQTFMTWGSVKKANRTEQTAPFEVMDPASGEMLCDWTHDVAQFATNATFMQLPENASFAAVCDHYGIHDAWATDMARQWYTMSNQNRYMMDQRHRNVTDKASYDWHGHFKTMRAMIDTMLTHGQIVVTGSQRRAVAPSSSSSSIAAIAGGGETTSSARYSARLLGQQLGASWHRYNMTDKLGAALLRHMSSERYIEMKRERQQLAIAPWSDGAQHALIVNTTRAVGHELEQWHDALAQTDATTGGASVLLETLRYVWHNKTRTWWDSVATSDRLTTDDPHALSRRETMQRLYYRSTGRIDEFNERFIYRPGDAGACECDLVENTIETIITLATICTNETQDAAGVDDGNRRRKRKLDFLLPGMHHYMDIERYELSDEDLRTIGAHDAVALDARAIEITVPDPFSLTDFIIPQLLDAVFGGSAGNSTQTLLKFLTNTNTDPDAGDVGFISYLVFYKCNYIVNLDCSRGFGLGPGLLITLALVLGTPLVLGLVFPTFLYRTLFTFVAPLLLVYSLQIFGSVAFGYNTGCLPALPRCAANELFDFFEQFFGKQCISWPAGLTTDVCPDPDGGSCSGRDFINCSDDAGFRDGFANVFFLLQWQAPSVAAFLRDSCWSKPVRVIGILDELLVRFDYEFQFGDAEAIPDVDKTCFWMTALNFIPLFAPLIVAWLLFSLALPSLTSIVGYLRTFAGVLYRGVQPLIFPLIPLPPERPVIVRGSGEGGEVFDMDEVAREEDIASQLIGGAVQPDDGSGGSRSRHNTDQLHYRGPSVHGV